MKLNKRDRKNIRAIIEKYESDIDAYVYIVKLFRRILKEEADK